MLTTAQETAFSAAEPPYSTAAQHSVGPPQAAGAHTNTHTSENTVSGRNCAVKPLNKGHYGANVMSVVYTDVVPVSENTSVSA